MSHPSEPVNDPYELAEPAGVPDRLPTSVLEDAHGAVGDHATVAELAANQRTELAKVMSHA